MRPFLYQTAFLLLLTCSANAQMDTLFRYLDDGYAPMKDPRMASIETVSLFTRISDSDWLMADYDLKTGKILARKHYQDSLMKTPIGPFERFHTNGRRWDQGSYVAGQKFGLYRRWYENGQIEDSVIYGENGIPKGVRLKWNDNGHLTDSTAFDSDGPGKGWSINRYDNGILYGQGPVLNGKRSGAWKFYRPDGTLATEETMEKDSAIAVRCFNPDGSVSTKDCFAERDAEFPGGPKKWLEYITGKLEKHYDYIVEKGGSGVCEVLFVIDTNGKVTDVRIKKSSGTYLDTEALEIIGKSPNWIPAIQHNRPVKAYRRQPFNFAGN